MAFWKFTGSSAESFPTLGFTAQPNEVYDLGTNAPPVSAVPRGNSQGLPVLKWQSNAGPATRSVSSAGLDLPPLVKQTGTPVAATDLATAITLVNSLRASLIALGLIS